MRMCTGRRRELSRKKHYLDSIQQSGGQAVNDGLRSAMEDAGRQRSRECTRETDAERFYQLTEFCGDEAVDPSLSKKLQLAAGEMSRLNAVSATVA